MIQYFYCKKCFLNDFYQKFAIKGVNHSNITNILERKAGSTYFEPAYQTGLQNNLKFDKSKSPTRKFLVQFAL